MSGVQCQFCNRFMSYRQVRAGVTWTPFGGVTDEEPPEAEHAHRKCWNDLDLAGKQLIERIAWHADATVRGIIAIDGRYHPDAWQVPKVPVGGMYL